MTLPAADPAIASAPPPRFPAADWRAVHLLALLVAIAACWAARELVVPVLLGLFLALVANPIVRRLERIRVPRWIGAFFVVIGGVALAVTLASQLVAPASEWVQKAPRQLREIAPKVKALARKVDDANSAAASLVGAAGATPSASRAAARAAAEEKPKPPNLWTVVRAAPKAITVVGAVILLAYFFVVYGVRLQRQAIAMLPDRQRKRLTTDIMQTLEIELSRYVFTITLINGALGTLLAGVLWALGLALGDALLWGAVGALLNFAPYVGPVIGVVLYLLVGVVAFDEPTQMLAPPLLYLGLQLIESELVTPIVLGRRWSISPLVVLLWLLFCGWLWGIAGVLLAVPMLVCFKIVAERVPDMDGWAAVIE